MAAPSYVNAGAGATDAGGAWTYTGAAPGAAGRILIAQILQDGTTDGALTSVVGTNVEDLAGADNVWTKVVGANTDLSFPVSTTARQHIYIGRSLSTTAPTISGGNSTSEDVYMRIYEFQNVSAGTTLATVIENATAGTATNGTGSGTTISDTGVQTLGPDRLALNFLGLDDGVQAAELTAMTGETNGDWTYPVTAYGTETGTDGTIALVNAAMATPATVNGGTDSYTTTAGWGVVGFALLGTTATQTAAAEVSLAGGTTPDTRTLHSLHIRARTTVAGTATMRMALYEGAANITDTAPAYLETTVLTASLADYSLAIADADAAAISSYADLGVRFWGYSSFSIPAVFEVDQVWLEIPATTAVPPRHGFVNHQEAGIV